MIIYGTAILAACHLLGVYIGDLLGSLIGVKANVGGVGFAMLLLILISDRLRRDLKLVPMSQRGIEFWSAMYIPIVVAMAARQNVVAAARGGILAVVAGVAGTVVTFALVPVLSRGAKREGALASSGQKEVR